MSDFTTPLVFKPHLAELVLAGSKTVTRRLKRDVDVPRRWRVGALSKVYDRQPYRGGVVLAEVRILSVESGTLADNLSKAELAREGCGGMTAEDFRELVRRLYGLECLPDSGIYMWRIEFELVRILK